MTTDAAISPRPSKLLMLATCIIGGTGYSIGIGTLQQDPPSLSVAALLAVTATGVLSFVRHAIYNRSDAVAGGWDYGRRNNSQIEVGLANLAWGVYALLAVVLGWGLMAVSASFLISGLYFGFVAIFVIVMPGSRQRKIGGIIGISVWAVMMIVMGAFGTATALQRHRLGPLGVSSNPGGKPDPHAPGVVLNEFDGPQPVDSLGQLGVRDFSVVGIVWLTNRHLWTLAGRWVGLRFGVDGYSRALHLRKRGLLRESEMNRRSR